MKKITAYTIPILLIIILLMGLVYYTTSPRRVDMSERNRQELALLDKMADKRLYYRDSLRHEIDSVMLQLHKHIDFTDTVRYAINKRMLMKTQMYSYEDANQFATKMQVLSEKMNDSNLIAEAKILSSFYLSQACLFAEAMEQLGAVDANQPALTQEMRSKYYFYSGITYQRMAIYVADTIYSNRYNAQGIKMFRKCIENSDNPVIVNFANGRIKERQNDMKSAQVYYQKALHEISGDDDIMLSLTLSSLGKAFKHQGYNEEALYYYTKAVQLNLQKAMNSSIAIVDLSDFLFSQYKNTSEARKYLGISIDNGEYYGMRSQITRIDSMFLSLSQMKMKRDLLLGIGFALILACVLAVVFVLISQNKKDSEELMRYKERSDTAMKTTVELTEENRRISKLNGDLANSNHLKNIYIGKLLEENGEANTTVNEFLMKANLLLKSGKYDQLQKALKEMENGFGKKEMLAHFDEIFLSLFPTFISEFKSLLPESYKIELGPKEMLTPSMRIFALIRLGISDNQQIAQVLNYSYNTILNYRLRVRNMALNPDKFEENIMKIGI